LEQSAEDLTNLLKKADFGSKEFKKLKQELINVNKEIKNTELGMESLDSEQVASELGSVAGAVGDMSAAFMLLGDSGGPMEKTVQNIEKAIGISMAFKGTIEGTQSMFKLYNNVIKTSTIFTKANNIITKIATIIQKAFTGSVNTTSKAFKGLKAAIVATGIGALVIAVGFAIEKIMSMTDATDDASAAQELLNKKTKALNDSITKQNELNSFYAKRLDVLTKKEIANAKLRGASEKELRLIQEKGAKKHLDILESENKAIQKKYTDGLFSATITNEELDILQAESQKSRQAFLDAEQNYELLQLDNRLSNKKAFEDKQKENNKLKEKNELIQIKKIEASKIDSNNKLKEAQFQLLQQLRNTDQENEIRDLVLQYEKKFELANGNAELEKALKEQQNKDVADIDKKYADKQTEIDNKLKKKKEDDRKADLEAAQAVENAKLQMSVDSISALMNLTSAFAKDNEKSQKRAFEINKKLQIAQAIIQTYQGANAIFASAAANPKTILFPAQPFIAAGLAIAGGLANVATISKQQFQSSSAGSTPSPSFNLGGGGGTAPQLSPVTNTSTIVPQGPTQVYVTETDITNTQNQVAVIQEQATLR
jgi:hypothetical protein